MDDVAIKFGEFMDDTAGLLTKEIQEYENNEGEVETHEVWFRQGLQGGWKWEHTEDGEPLG